MMFCVKLNFGIYIWQSQTVTHPKQFVSAVSSKLIARFKGGWFETAQQLDSLDSYILFKKDHQLEKYFEILENPQHLIGYVRLRLHSHQLEIERGRHLGIRRDQRLCQCCDMQVTEDERHFILSCPLYDALRQSFLPPACLTMAPSIANYGKLMAKSDPVTILGIAKYIYFANKIRISHLLG